MRAAKDSARFQLPGLVSFPIASAIDHRSGGSNRSTRIRTAKIRLICDLFWRKLNGTVSITGRVAGHSIPALLTQLLDSEVSRPVFGSHPRVAIYGLLEARLQQADFVICAGLNEGTWPQMPQPDPWLSPRLRHELKLPGLERNIGLSAHDLMSLLGTKDVVLSRAMRDRSGPTVASRFLLRH